MIQALNGLPPPSAYLGRDLMLLLPDEKSVRDFELDWNKICALPDGMGFLFTTKVYGDEYDFVSRTFFHQINVNEDSVCGSAHCNFVPF